MQIKQKPTNKTKINRQENNKGKGFCAHKIKGGGNCLFGFLVLFVHAKFFRKKKTNLKLS